MATNINAVLLLTEPSASISGDRNFPTVDVLPPAPPLTNSQRALINSSVAAGTVVTSADAYALIKSAAVAAAASQAQVWQFLNNPSAPSA